MDCEVVYTIIDETDCSQSLFDIPTRLKDSKDVPNSSLYDNYSPILHKKDTIENENRDKVTWIEPATKLLMALIQEYRPNLGKTLKLKTKKKMWDAIADVMRDHGYIYSATQIENKYKSLERSFKNNINHNKKTGRNRVSCSYERELNDIFKGRDNIFPKYTLEATGNGITQEELQEQAGIEVLSDSDAQHELEENITCYPQDKEQSSELCDQPSTPTSECSSKKPNKSIVRELSLIRREKQAYNEKKIDLQAKKLKAYELRTKEVAEKNSLLKELISVLSKPNK